MIRFRWSNAEKSMKLKHRTGKEKYEDKCKNIYIFVEHYNNK